MEWDHFSVSLYIIPVTHFTIQYYSYFPNNSKKSKFCSFLWIEVATELLILVSYVSHLSGTKYLMKEFHFTLIRLQGEI